MQVTQENARPSVEGELLELGEVNNAVAVLVENREKALDVVRLRREFQRLQPRLNLRWSRGQGSVEQGRIRVIICGLRGLVRWSSSGQGSGIDHACRNRETTQLASTDAEPVGTGGSQSTTRDHTNT